MRGLTIAGTMLALLLPLLLTGQTPQATPPDQKAVLQGRVVNSQTGEPLRKATLHLTRRAPGPVPNGIPQSYTGTSQPDGTFRFEAVEPGSYNLSGERSGFLNTQYGQRFADAPGAVLNLRAGQQMTDVTLKLNPQAVISGKVVDEDGDPVDNAMIQVLAQTWMRGKLRYLPRGGNSTNDRGEFRIANLGPGKYYISAEKREVNFRGGNEAPAIPGKPEIRHIRTYFPDAGNIESAALIEVKSGQDLAGMDIHLRSAQTYHIRGRIAGYVSPGDSERPILNQRFMLNLSPQQDEFPTMLMGASPIDKDGNFDLAGVAPGSYTLTAQNMSNNGSREIARQLIQVGSADVNDVVLTMVSPGSLSGRIHIEGTPPAGTDPANLARIRIRLSADGPVLSGGVPNAQPGDDGTFKLENVSPGKYYCNVGGAPDGAYLKSVRFGQQEILGKELDLTQGVFGELDITFRYGVAEVDGTALLIADPSSTDGSNGQPGSIPTASVVLVPDVLNADGSGMLFGGTNSSGAFTIKQVPPGHYRAYAFEHMNMNQLQNPEILKQLESRGTELEVAANDKKEIQLSIISMDDMRKILVRLGIDSQ
jgi:hypothetical protein